MADLATLKVRVDATEAVNATKQLGTALGAVDTEGAKVSRRMLDLRSVFQAVAGSLIVREFVRFADTAQLLEGRLKLVAQNSAELAAVQAQLFASAQRTRTSYEGAVELYARVARATQDLGIAQADMLRFTELTNMAIKTSGASSAEASAALIQLSQGLAAGVLRGEEFNSVMEQTPAVAQNIAAALGVGIGQLRAMAQNGQLTAKTVIDAMLSMEQQIRTDFQSVPRTVGDAFTVLRNDTLKAIADINAALGGAGTTGLAGGLTAIGSSVIPAVSETLVAFLKGFELMAVDAAIAVQKLLGRVTLGAQRAKTMLAEVMTLGFANTAPILQRAQNQYDALVVALEHYRREQYAAIVAGGEQTAQFQRQTRAAREMATALGDAATAQKMLTASGSRAAGLGGGMVTRVGGTNPADMAADAQARMSRAIQNANAILRSEQAGKALQTEYANRVAMQADLARNFRENMQRAFGDVLTEFVTNGKVSMQAMFSSLSQMGASMMGQVLSRVTMNLFPANMGAGSTFGVGLGLGLIGAGANAVFSANARRKAARERDRQEQAAKDEANRIAAADIARRQAEEREARNQALRDFQNGATAGRGGVIQSVGQVLQETTASRMIGELVAIRIATTRTADAVERTASSAMGGGMVDMVDRVLGTRVQNLRLTSGAAVTV